MKILVLGGTRFVGKLLIEKLIDEGHDITILTRGTTSDNFGNKVKRIKCLRSDRKQMEEKLKNCKFDVVYDHICFSSGDAKITSEIFKDKISKYIFISSMFVYETNNQRGLREEDFDPALCKMRMEFRPPLSYEEGKRFAEAYFLRYAKFPVISVRFPIIMGSKDYTGRFNFHIEKILSNKEIYVPGNSGKMNYINMKEAADFLFWLKDLSWEGQINAASKEAFTADEVIKLFGDILKIEPNIIRNDSDGNQTISPYYKEGGMYMQIERAASLGYKFSSFHSWFSSEVEDVLKNMEDRNCMI